MNTTINVKIDTTLKQDASKIADELGMSLGTLIKVLLKQTIRKKGIHLDIHDDSYPAEQMTPAMEALIAEYDQPLRDGTIETISHEEFMDELRSHEQDRLRDTTA